MPEDFRFPTPNMRDGSVLVQVEEYFDRVSMGTAKRVRKAEASGSTIEVHGTTMPNRVVEAGIAVMFGPDHDVATRLLILYQVRFCFGAPEEPPCDL